MEKKYRLLKDRTICVNGHILYRIQALKSFKDVKINDIGGFVESISNLNHKGNCWVYNNAMVYGNANVSGNTVIKDIANIYDNATIFGDAKVCGNAHVCNNSRVGDNAIVKESALVCDNSIIKDSSMVYGTALIKGATKLYGRCRVFDDAIVSNVTVSDAILCSSAFVDSNVKIATLGPLFPNKRNTATLFTDCRNNVLVAISNNSGLVEKCHGVTISDFILIMGKSKSSLTQEELDKYFDVLKYATYIFRPNIMNL